MSTRYIVETERKMDGKSWIVDTETSKKIEMPKSEEAHIIAGFLNAGAIPWEAVEKMATKKQEPRNLTIEELSTGIRNISIVMDALTDRYEEMVNVINELIDKVEMLERKDQKLGGNPFSFKLGDDL